MSYRKLAAIIMKPASPPVESQLTETFPVTATAREPPLIEDDAVTDRPSKFSVTPVHVCVADDMASTENAAATRMPPACAELDTLAASVVVLSVSVGVVLWRPATAHVATATP